MTGTTRINHRGRPSRAWSRRARGGIAVPPIEEEEGEAFDPITGVAWHHVFWADDPANGFGADTEATAWEGHTYDIDGSDGPTFRSSVAALNGKGALHFAGTNILDGAPFSSIGAELSIVAVFNSVALPAGITGIVLMEGSTLDGMFIAPNGELILGNIAGSQIISAADMTGAGHAARGYLDGATSHLNVDGVDVEGDLSATAAWTGSEAVGNFGGVTEWESKIAFLGVKAGDVTADAGWAAFVSWVSTYYGKTLA